MVVSSQVNLFFEQAREKITSFLTDFVNKNIEEPLLRDACLHLLTRGKMLRGLAAFSVLKTLCPQANVENYLGEISSLELVQCFTLIHDDLPAMDNAQMRRGVETVHRKYGEAIAILAGDELFALAFNAILSGSSTPKQKLKLVDQLSQTISKVIQGQAFELELSGKAQDLQTIEKVISLKTTSLIVASFKFGGILANAKKTTLSALEQIATYSGLAYQAKDDLLCVTAIQSDVGKTLETDTLLGRPTIISVLGVYGAKAYFEQKMKLSKEALHSLFQRENLLEEFLNLLEKRKR